MGADKYRFGEFLLDAGARQLRRGDDAIALTPKEFQTLLVLVRSHGQAVEREFILRSVWPDTVVGDTSLARNISVLRRHLGSTSIEAVPRYGYRFALPVQQKHFEGEPEESSGKSPEAPGGAEALQQTPIEPTYSDLSPNGKMGLSPWFPVGLWSNPVFRFGSVAVMVLLAFAVVAGTRGLGRQPRSESVVAARQEPVRLAILPFRNISANPADSDYLRDGMADEITTRLGELNLSPLRVLARSTTRQYVDTVKPTREIAAETGAQYLLEGSVGFDKSKARVSVNLVDTRSEAVVWAKVLERPLNDLSGLQEEIANRVATTPTLSGTTKLPSEVPKESPSKEAHDEYMRGRFELAQTRRESYQRALTHFERAVQIDNQYSKAYTGIAESYIYMTDTLPLTFCYSKARDSVMTALRLNDNLSEAHRDLAYLQMNERNDLHGAEVEFLRALSLNTDDARSHHWYALMLAAQRRSEESLQQARIGYELDPRSVGSMANYGYLLVQAGELKRGLDLLESVLKIDPENEMTLGYLGIAYERMHRYKDAASAFDHAAGFESFSASYLADAAYARAKDGDATDAKRVMKIFLKRMQLRQWLPAQAMAMTEIALGNKAEAREWLHKGVEDHTVTLFELNSEPFYSEMKSDPEFQSLLAEAGLKP